MSRSSRKAAAKALASSHKKQYRFTRWFKSLTTWKKVLVITVPTFIVVAGAATVFLFGKLSDIQRDTLDPKELSIVDVDGYTNILFLGVDTRDINSLQDARSDAIMVISINEETKDVKLISLYRDTYLKMGSEDTYDKVNHAFALGGPQMSIKTINQALDLNIQNYVVFNFKAVADLIDAIGGVEVDVQPEEIEPLNEYAEETAEIIGQSNCPTVTQPGKQTLVGVQAVSYGRIRKGVGDDYKRTERMRSVLTIAAEKVKNLNASQISNIIDLITPQIKTTLSNSDIISLSLDVGNYNINGSIGFPYEKDSGMYEGTSYVYPLNLANDVKKLHQEVFGQKNYQVSQLCRQISNHVLSVFGPENSENNLQNGSEDTLDYNNNDNNIDQNNSEDSYQDENNTDNTKDNANDNTDDRNTKHKKNKKNDN